MATTTKAPPASFQASSVSARNSAAAVSAVTGTAAVVSPANQVSTWGSPRYHSHKQNTLAERAYQVASSQVGCDTALRSKGIASNASGAAPANATTLAPRASRSGR